MSKGPATAVHERATDTTRIVGSAVIVGQAKIGARVFAEHAGQG